MKKAPAKPIYEKVLNSVPVALAFLMPVFFLPITTEFFEFNKQFLLVTGTIILLITWALKILLGKKLELTRSYLDIPLIMFLMVTLFSTVFSINKTSSIYGSTGRWFPSLLGYVTLVLFYYLVSSGVASVKTMKRVLNGLVGAITLASFVALLSYFGIYLGKAPFLQIPNFTLTGSITTTVLLAALAVVISISLLAYAQSSGKRISLLVATMINITLISILNLWMAWAVLLVGLVAMVIILKPQVLDGCKNMLFILGAFTILMVALVNVPQTKGFFTNTSYPVEITLPLRESWGIATSIIRDYPLLATGSSTFYLNFTRYRPLSLNNTELWNIRFDKPFNEVLNITAELGLLGLLAMIFLGIQVFKLVKLSAQVKDDNAIIKVLGIAVLTTSVMFLVTYATTLNSFVMFLLLALFVRSFHVDKSFSKASSISIITLSKTGNVTSLSGLTVETSKNSFLMYAIVIPCFTAALYGGYMTTRNYLSEYYTRSALYAAQDNNWDKVYKQQERAIKANPRKDGLYTRHAQTVLALANNLAAKETLTDQDKTLIQNLVAKAINVSKVASENINPLNVRTWETRALIYKSIAQAAQNAVDWSIASYNIAIQLDPSNPKLRLDLGGMYYAKGDYLSAASQFRQAVSLKPNYANAYYNFAQALLKLGDYNNAVSTLETVKALIPEGSEDYNKVEQEIAMITSQLNVAGATDQKPTVEELTAQAEEPKEDTQEPLATVGEEEETIAENIDEDTLVEETTPQPEETPEELPQEQQ